MFFFISITKKFPFSPLLQNGLTNVFDEAILAALEPPGSQKTCKCVVLWTGHRSIIKDKSGCKPIGWFYFCPGFYQESNIAFSQQVFFFVIYLGTHITWWDDMCAHVTVVPLRLQWRFKKKIFRYGRVEWASLCHFYLICLIRKDIFEVNTLIYVWMCHQLNIEDFTESYEYVLSHA